MKKKTLIHVQECGESPTPDFEKLPFTTLPRAKYFHSELLENLSPLFFDYTKQFFYAFAILKREKHIFFAHPLQEAHTMRSKNFMFSFHV
jgi:hypothetical protein